MAGIDPDGLGGILEADSGSLTGERVDAADVVIDDIGLSDAGVPD